MTTFRKFIPTIHIHPILIIFILISFLTGTFVELFIILMIVFIHELGHYLMSQIFNWRVHHITLWIFGGVMITEEHGNKALYEELLVTIAGPFQHLLIYSGLFLFGEIIPSSIWELIFYYNTIILLFNLIPIWPLDGGKFLFLLLTATLPYRKAYHFTIIFSMMICVLFLLTQLLIYSFTLSAFFIIIFLFIENRTEWKHRYYVFIRFLLKRYEGNTRIKKIQPISVLSQDTLMQVFARFRREKRHAIYIIYPNQKRKSIEENDCLHSYFNDKEYHKSIGEIMDKMT